MRKIARGPQHLRQLHAVALAAREDADGGVGEAVVEEQHAQEGARVHRAVLEEDGVVVAGDLLEDGAIVTQLGAPLVEVREAGVLADDDRAGVGGGLAEDGADEGRFARAVGADDADADRPASR
jgi:hypothetical protein